MENFHPLGVVGRGSETQIQWGDNLNFLSSQKCHHNFIHCELCPIQYNTDCIISNCNCSDLAPLPIKILIMSIAILNRSRPQGAKNAHNFLLTLQPMSLACDHSWRYWRFKSVPALKRLNNAQIITFVKKAPARQQYAFRDNPPPV